MIHSIHSFLETYLSRPTVVAMDLFILSLGIAVLIGVVLLKRRVNDLAMSIKILGDRIMKGKDNS
jgi:hypothetical protein